MTFGTIAMLQNTAACASTRPHPCAYCRTPLKETGSKNGKLQGRNNNDSRGKNNGSAYEGGKDEEGNLGACDVFVAPDGEVTQASPISQTPQHFGMYCLSAYGFCSISHHSAIISLTMQFPMHTAEHLAGLSQAFAKSNLTLLSST